ncbi:hypothetical protein PMAYCL1PPCAC_17838, partial [Pristionchus mayeri]
SIKPPFVLPLIVSRMKFHTATLLASSCSGLTLIVSLFLMAHIYVNVQEFWNELDSEIVDFRATTDDLWRDLVALSPRYKREEQYKEGESSGGYGAKPSEGVISAEPPAHMESNPPGTALASACNCNAKNKCPKGPPGPKGTPGSPGPNGDAGIDGHDGIDADDLQIDNIPMDRCYYCPPGLHGPPGTNGRPGLRGMAGPDGAKGSDGRDGMPGMPGPIGAPGAIGREGYPGPPGEKGMDGRKPMGRPGPKGLHGPAGPPGP